MTHSDHTPHPDSAPAPAGPSWLDMSPEDFTTQPRAIQNALFVAPDPYGTPDLYEHGAPDQHTPP